MIQFVTRKEPFITKGEITYEQYNDTLFRGRSVASPYECQVRTMFCRGSAASPMQCQICPAGCIESLIVRKPFIVGVDFSAFHTEDIMDSLHSLFDENFKLNIWDKKPAQIKLPKPFEIVAEENLVEALRRYVEAPEMLKKNNKLAEFVTGLNCIKTQDPILDFAIRKEDCDLDSYLHRVDSANGSNEWSIAYFGLHGASPIIWDRAKQFVDNLAQTVGFRPGGRVDVDCFIGRYASTPSGIHVDDAHNFGFTFRSGKTMYTWPAFRKELCWLKSPEYDAFKPESIPLKNEVGYVCYFPYDALHVGETKGDVSVNMNISLWRAADDGLQNVKYLESQLQQTSVTETTLKFSGKTQLSTSDYSNLRKIEKLLSSGKLERQMALSHLLTQTTSGMKVPRPIFPRDALNEGAGFRLCSTATVQWYEMDSLEEMFIAANGHCISCNYDFAVIEFLDFLTKRGREGFNVLNLRDIPKSHYDEIRNLVMLLHTWGAIENV